MLSVIRSVCRRRRSGPGVGAALIERSVLVCNFGGSGGAGDRGLLELWGAYGPKVPKEKGSFARNTCQVSHKQSGVMYFKLECSILILSP
ncbi:Mitochondrial Rho GTPase 1, partial [Dissostichus eleginoides]